MDGYRNRISIYLSPYKCHFDCHLTWTALCNISIGDISIIFTEQHIFCNPNNDPLSVIINRTIYLQQSLYTHFQLCTKSIKYFMKIWFPHNVCQTSIALLYLVGQSITPVPVQFHNRSLWKTFIVPLRLMWSRPDLKASYQKRCI